MTFKKWDIVLVPFPFTNLQSVKKNPALILSPENYNNGPDLVILFITSNLSAYGRMGDCLIQNWKQSGPPKPSMTRMNIATIEKSIVLRKLGRIQEPDQKTLVTKSNSFSDFETWK